ncbi:MAG: type II/IV secretion system protein [Alphaproteobacteria bacterium]|nr:type II/IV secretion system protein [Alphaproteobacteria bacterium]
MSSPKKGPKKTVEELESESTGTASIGERLIAKGLISKDQLEVALREQRQTGSKKMLGTILVDMGFITEAALGDVFTESTGIEQYDLKSAALDPELVRKIPKEVAIRNKVIPVSMTGDKVLIAMTDVYNIMVLDQIKRYFDKTTRIVPVYASPPDIIEMIDIYYAYEMSIGGILKEIETGISDESITLSGEGEGYTNPTIRLVDALLIDAVKKQASDLHFEPEENFLRLRYRIDGELRQIRTFHKNYWPAIAVRIKILSDMNIAETRRPQDGRINYNILGRVIDFRVATHPTIHGENIVMRVLDRKNSLMPLEKLGFPAHSEALLKKCIKRPEGIIIITGPTGSGKTTTLYSILSYINSMTVNIMTLEDPVEYQLSLIRQTNIKAEVGMDFKSGIKSLMRQDPNIVFVGEVRDEDTATLAVRAAMTGHQVYTTLHTNDAMGAIPRLIDIGVKNTLLSGSLICILAQRLVRRLCPKCKVPHTATADECRILGVDPNSPPTIYEHKGCDECEGMGYKGRIGVTEILPVDKELDDMIARGETRKVMLEHAKSHGFITMQDEAIDKIKAGMTDLEEVIKNIDMTERL